MYGLSVVILVLKLNLCYKTLIIENKMIALSHERLQKVLVV